MKHEFTNGNPVPIPAASPNSIQSTIDVTGAHSGIRDVNVTLDIDHSWTNDLKIVLEAPSGDRVLLVEREGGSGDNFRVPPSMMPPPRSIVGAGAPFTGTFQPEESLGRFDGQEANGTWTLHIDDQAAEDGGTLNAWSLSIEDGSAHFENTDPVINDAGGEWRIRRVSRRLPNRWRLGGSAVRAVSAGGIKDSRSGALLSMVIQYSYSF
jgi:subtilisin-like proprotein convertase family protein